MRPHCTALVAGLLLAVPTSAAAADYQVLIDRFFVSLRAGKSAEAVDALYATNAWMSAASDQVVTVKNQFASLAKLIGELRSLEKVQERKVGTRFVHVTYMVIYDRQPVRFEFQFFRPEGEWKILGFSFDDKLDDDVQAAARAQVGACADAAAAK